MIFQVEWQELVYDVFNRLKEIKNQPLFEILANSLELGKERAQTTINRTVIMSMREQTGKQKGEMIVGEIIALIDEKGVRHQLQER